MSKTQLSAPAVRALEPKLNPALPPADRPRLEQLIELVEDSGRIRLDRALYALFPDKEKDGALTAFRQFRARLVEAAGNAGVLLSLESDSKTRSSPEERWCHFEGANIIGAAAVDFSVAETAPLRRGPTVEQPFVEMRDDKPLVRCYLSYSGCDQALKARLVEKLRPRLLNSAKVTYELFDRAELLAGDDLDKVMAVELGKADLVVALVSQEWLAGQDIPEVERRQVLGLDGTKHPPRLPVALGRLPKKAEEIDWRGLDPVTLLRDSKGLSCAEGKDAEAFADCLAKEIEARVARDIYPLPEKQQIPVRSQKAGQHALCHLRDKQDELRRYTESYAFLGGLDTWERADRRGPNAEGVGTERRKVVQDLMEWLADPLGAPYCALLGETGMGKTTACLYLVQRLVEERKQNFSVRIPIYLDLRKLRTRLTPGRNQEAVLPKGLGIKDIVETVIAGTVQSTDSPLTAEEVIRLVQDDGALVIFDGLDEVLVHLSAADGQAFTRELYRVLPPSQLGEREEKKNRGRLIITCRTQYFRTLSDQTKHFLAEDRDGIVRQDYRALVLLPFQEEQIRDYLQRAVPDQNPDRILELFRSVHNLSELAERPYTLSLLADRIAEIERWKMEGRKVTGVTVYGAFTAAWLKRDDPKHTFAPAHKALLMEHLAAELWRSGRKTWSVDDLEQWLVDFLASRPDVTRHYGAQVDGTLGDRHLIELFKEDLRTATFLAREGDAAFRFAHTSLQEYFLAGYLCRALREDRLAAWVMPRVSRETLDFLGQLILEDEDSGETASLDRILSCLRRLRDAPPTGAATLAFAYVLHAIGQGYPTPQPAGFRLAGADLRGWEIGGEPGKLLALGRADFSGARLEGAIFRHVNLDGANFSRAGLNKAEFHVCWAVGARFEEARLAGAIFRESNLWKADFAGAECHRTQWLQCRMDQSFSLPAGFLAPAPSTEAVALLRSAPPRLVSFDGHCSFITSCAFSPDGERLVSAGDDQTLHIWDAQTGDCLLILSGHEGPVRACAFSPDGKRLVSAGDDETLRVWDAQSGGCLLTLTGHKGIVQACVFSPDGERLASSGDDETVRLWNARTGGCLLILAGHEGRVLTCAFSPNGERIASAGDDQALRLWDAESGDCLMTLAKHEKKILACAFSPDGERLASISADGILRFWDALTGDCFLSLLGHRGVGRVCTFSSDGERLVSAGADELCVWDVRTGDCLLALAGHHDGVVACAFSPDGKRLASAGLDQVLRLWDARSGDCLLNLFGYGEVIGACALSPDGGRLVSVGDDQIMRLWDARTGTYLFSFSGHGGWVWCCAFSANGDRLVSAGDDGILRLWDVRSGDSLLTFAGHSGMILSCAFSPDGKSLISAGDDHSLRLWDTESGECLLVLTGHKDWVRVCAFSPDGERLASGSDDKTLRLWDSRTGECLLTLVGHDHWVMACTFAPDGGRLASASGDGGLRLWDVQTGDCLTTLSGHMGWIRDCDFSPDGERLASVGDDQTMRLWDTRTGNCLRVINGHEGGGRFCAFAPDGERIVSSAADGALRFWSASTGDPIAPLIRQFSGGAWAVLDMPNNRVIQAHGDVWRYLGWLISDPVTGRLERYPIETFGPLPMYEPKVQKAEWPCRSAGQIC